VNRRIAQAWIVVAWLVLAIALFAWAVLSAATGGEIVR